MITLKELKIRVLKMIEEYIGSEMSDDSDIENKFPVFINQGIKKILQVKPIIKFCTLPFSDAERFGAFLLFRCPDDLYQLRSVSAGDGDVYWHTADGNTNYIKTKDSFSGDIFIEYAAFHEEISSDSPSDTVIGLTSDCLPILENFVACALTVDSPDINGYFDSEYKGGLQNLKEAITDRLVQIIDI